MSVVGSMDAVALVKNLKKVVKVNIVSVGPAKVEKKEEMKEGKKEVKKEEKKLVCNRFNQYLPSDSCY